MSIGYIYPEWYAAQRKLVEALEAHPGQTAEIVLDFFKNHFFQVGVSTRVHLGVNEQALAVHREYYAEKAGCMIGKELLRSDLFMRETRVERGYEEITEYRVLVFGAPKVVLPGTREAIDILRKKVIP